MENVTVSVEDGKIVVEIDTEVSLGLSKTGRSTLVASTRGYASVPGTDVVLNLNATKPVA